MQWQDIKKCLYNLDYIASDELAMSIHIAKNLDRPLLLEGEAGIGKTALAIALSELYETNLIRLQCYEGLDSCLLYTSPSPRDKRQSRMPSSA